MLKRLRTYFLTGLLVLAPVVITGYIIWKLFVFLDHLTGATLRGGYIRPGGVPGIGFVTVILIITLTGALANNILGRSLGGVFEGLILRVPFLRGVYLTLKEMGEALLSDKKGVFQRVVLVPFPGPGVYSIGLVTTPPPRSVDDAVGTALEGVFIPTPPNPTTGHLVYYPLEQVIPTTLRVEQAVKMILSGGVVVPAGPVLSSQEPAPNEMGAT
ncbi:MAG: DUF502 domain-containing protein [Candidatus Eisenbacteria bacterium]|uniref:DUF502 domain-containing protein n=1 Tax=Eiseniibacteriota bacterium TaxID=2212470 RepID=A0A538TIF4_UNCEI|nr:MAG: DUF502 domain-containing protein [Candidatus Eisenbacteria bacterium]